MPRKIDEIDRAIARLLREDGRMSCAEIARRIGSDVSARKVRYRLNQLIEKGIISIRARVIPEAVGFPVTGDVFIQVEAGRVLEAAHKIAELECVSYVACSTGDRDLSIQIHTRNNDELYRLVTEIIGRLPGVTKTSTVLLPIVVKDVNDWAIPESTCDG